MNISSSANASTCDGQRKYFHWHLKVLAFFTGVIDKILFSTKSFCSLNSKGEPTRDSPL